MIQTKASWLALAICIVLIGGCKTSPTVVDSSLNAAAAGDATALVSGCGTNPVVGFAYCRKSEGTPTDRDTVTFYGPPASCRDKTACTFIMIFSPVDGVPVLAVAIPRDKTSVSVKLSEITKKPVFEKRDRGYWPFVARTVWTDKDDDSQEHETLQEGEIRLRILAKEYVPLNTAKDDPAFGWEWVDGPYRFKMSTAGRAYVGNH